MPLEIVYGISGNTIAVSQLISSLRQVCDEGTLYIGYPKGNTTLQPDVAPPPSSLLALNHFLIYP